MSAKIATALHAVMEACGYVQKTGKNSFHGYKYAGESDLLDKLRPAMVANGLLLLPSGKSVTGPDEHGNVTVAIEYTLAHKDGEIWPEKLVAFGCGNDRAKNGSVGDKGVYKALTGANKYLLFKLFQIETGDDPELDDRAHESAPMTGRNVPVSSGLRTSSEAGTPLSAERSRTNVAHSANRAAEATSAIGETGAPLSEPAKAFIFAADKAKSADELRQWMDDVEPELSKLPPHEVAAVKDHARFVWRALSQKEAA
jgi:hypothetical protein